MGYAEYIFISTVTYGGCSCNISDVDPRKKATEVKILHGLMSQALKLPSAY